MKMKLIGMFNVRIIRHGDRYGLEDCLEVKGEPMIEFYDFRHADKEFALRGYFVSRYYLSTLVDGEARLSRAGLCLNGGVPEWVVSAFEMRQVFEYIRACNLAHGNLSISTPVTTSTQ